MALIRVDELPDLGFPELDAEHREVVRLMNQLHDASTLEKDPQVLNSILQELVAFTKSHFAEEEQVMEKLGYPAQAEHKRQHQEVLGMLLAFQGGSDAGDSISNIAMLELLQGWLGKHIPTEDKRLAVWYRARRGPQAAWKIAK
ncbi:MAG TPA: hemerythrin family protein [Terriglobales bacterium]|nr:hemerythrin family protein [Terriglobales bacterium]